jgi:Flp pilus assembly protein TadG
MIGPPPLRRLTGDARGVALIEFALSLPILILMYLGAFQISDAISCNRKVTITTRSVADLTSRYATLSSSDLTSILNASTQIMAPYDASNATVVVSQLATDINGNTTIDWSQANQGSGHTPTQSYTLPTTIKKLPTNATDKTYIIVAEVSYAYRPLFNFGIISPITLHDTIYMYPRISNSVVKS